MCLVGDGIVKKLTRSGPAVQTSRLSTTLFQFQNLLLMMLMAPAQTLFLEWMTAPARAACPVMLLVTAWNAAVVAGGCTTAKATCAVVASLHPNQLLLHRLHLRHLRLTSAPAEIQQNSMTATTRGASPAPVKVVQNVVTAAIWSQTQPRELTAWRISC